MPRSARLDFPGVLQHVIVRGIERRDIFLDEQDRFSFLERLSSLLKNTETRCYAWSLLSNHAHLLLVSTTVPLSNLMRRLLTGHAVVFNRKYNRSGHLFQNRYKSIVCEEEPYLLELVRYIHLNPLRAGLVANLEELDRFLWCGHSVLMGNNRLEGQETEEILDRFGKNLFRARQNYRQFVSEGVLMGKRENLVGGGLRRRQGEKSVEGGCECYDERILGSGSFVERLRQEEIMCDKIRSVLSLRELTKRVCSLLNIDPEAMRLPSKAKAIAEARGVISYLAIRNLGYKGKEVGQALHLGPTGVSIAVRRGERLVMSNPELKNRVVSCLTDE